jgi:Domain of unknown function (DUF4384)
MMRKLLARLAIFMLLTVPACSAVAPNHDHAGEVRDCNGEQRVMLDCSSEVSYQGASGEAGIKVMDIASAEGKFEERAIRRVNEQVEQFVAVQTRACRDYNACVLSRDQYRAEAAETRRRLQVIPALTEALKSAKSEGERTKALDELYRGVVPDEKRVEEVTFHLSMVADIPTDLGGGVFSVPPGGAVPTGAKVIFQVDVSRDAYVYIFQATPRGEVNVLFPDPRIGTQNPLAGGVTGRIPSGKFFRVNQQDVGTEKVFVVASAKPVENLDAALNKVKSGQVNTLAQDQTLTSVAMVAPAAGAANCHNRGLVLEGDDGGSAGGCSRPRALELEDDGGPAPRSGPVPPGMQVRTPPGDDLIVTVFPFEHMTPAQYQAAGGTKRSGTNVRGVVVEE